MARIRLGKQAELRLGNLDVHRDWGYAGDYVEAMWLMLQQEQAADFVVGTGISHSVQDFVELAFRHAGIDDWQKYVVIDDKLFRPAEVSKLVADNSKARSVLGWQPKVTFEELVAIMVQADLAQESSTRSEGQQGAGTSETP